VAANASGAGTTTVQPYSISSRTTNLDLNYSWLAYVSEDKTATISGGYVLNNLDSKSGGDGGNAKTDRNYLYSQMMIRAAPMRALFISMTLRGEWDHSILDATDATGKITADDKQRSLYSIDGKIQYRFRKLFFELQYIVRNETGTVNPYNRESIYFKVSRPF
jgi:hypothetical protein